MTRCVDERHLAIAGVGLVGADVLGDAAELPADDVGLADRVQELRLPVIDVSHHRHNGRAPNELRLVDLLVLFLGLQLVFEPDDVGGVAEVGGDELDRFVR